MTITYQHRDTIEMIALQGKAIASLLGTSCPLDDASREDLQTALHALEGFFSSILEALESTAIDAEQNALPLKICP